jgi:ribose transport system permease protein
MSTDAFSLTGKPWIRRFSLQRSVAELLGKRWMEAVVPVLLLIVTTAYFIGSTPRFTSSANLTTLSKILAEVGLVALGLTIVLLAGGIDISVGAMFGLVNIASLILFKEFGWPVAGVAVGAIAAGAAMGLLNGVLVAYGKTRPFITTLVTLLLFRTVTQYLEQRYTRQLSITTRFDDAWEFLTTGKIGGVPFPLVLLLAVALLMHVLLTRTRFGWKITAVGSSRTAARRAGMNLKRITLASFIVSGALTGLAGLLQASRLQQSSSATGVGMEFTVLTAVVLGGVSLSGGRGTAARALIGALVVSILSQGFTLQGRERDLYTAVLAVILLVFAAIDLKWGKNRGKAIQKIFLVPGTVSLPALPDIYEPTSVWALNDRLTGAEPIGLGRVEGPEDVAFDRAGRLYCGDRRGWIWRFSGDDYSDGEVFARVGGLPLGMTFDADDNLVICIGGMGLYSVTPSGHVNRLGTEVPRSWYKLVDDSAIRVADDLDIAPDGKIYFSDASTRFDGTEWHFDILESRPNGRVLCYDPATGKTTTVLKNCSFPNGVCVSHDGQSILINSTILCRIDRYWIDGPKKGQFEPFLVDLPGLPDNINRASDGGYWLAFAGMRTPAFDLTMRHPGFRRRMVKELPGDEWLLPNMNTSCVVKVTETGEVVECLWDGSQRDHAVITSMREHEGYLYLGGLTNNRVGRVRLDQPGVTRETARAGAASRPGA